MSLWMKIGLAWFTRFGTRNVEKSAFRPILSLFFLVSCGRQSTITCQKNIWTDNGMPSNPPPTGCPEISVLHDGRECLVTTEVTSVFSYLSNSGPQVLYLFSEADHSLSPILTTCSGGLVFQQHHLPSNAAQQILAGDQVQCPTFVKRNMQSLLVKCHHGLLCYSSILLP